MEAVIYDELDSPFAFFDSAPPLSYDGGSNPIDTVGSLPMDASNNTRMDALPLDAPEKDIKYTFSVRVLHEMDLKNSRFSHFTRQSRLRFAPRHVPYPIVKPIPSSPVPHLLGTNLYPSSRNVPLVRELIRNLKAQIEAFEDDLFLFRTILDQLSRDGSHLAHYMDANMPSEQRVDLIPAQFPLASEPPSDVYIRKITFEFETSGDTDLQISPPVTLRFPVFDSFHLSDETDVGLGVTGNASSTDEEQTQKMLREDYKRIAQNTRVFQSIIERLELELNCLNHFISDHVSLLSPINKCPNEIIAEIFWHYFSWYDESFPEMDIDVVPLPFILGRVSARWWYLSKSLSFLWSIVHVQLNIQTLSPSVIMGLPRWLKRAKLAKTLSLRIVVRHKHTISWRSKNDDDWDFRDLQENINASVLFRLLSDNASRWRRVEFFNCPPRLLLSFMKLLHDKTPNLQSLTIGGPDNIPWEHSKIPDSVTCPDISWSLPQDAHVTLSKDWLICRNMSSVFPLERIRSLTLSDVYVLRTESCRRAADILAQCTSLEQCKLIYTHTSSALQRSLTNPSVTVANLRDLEVTMDRPEGLLDMLTLPKLKQLRLSFVGHEGQVRFSNGLIFVKQLFDRSQLDTFASFDCRRDGQYMFEST